MGVRGTSTGGRVITMDTLIRTKRALRGPRTPLHLPIPDGMTAPLGYDAVSVPARFGPRALPRLPRLGCVYADAEHWWWLVPADSDYALEWPAPRTTPPEPSSSTPRASRRSCTDRTTPSRTPRRYRSTSPCAR